MAEYRTRRAPAGGYNLVRNGAILGWYRTPEEAGDAAEEDRQSRMPADAAALRRIMLMAYAGVDDTTTDSRRDYGRMDEDLRLIAQLAGLRYETPDYVRDLLTMYEEEE